MPTRSKHARARLCAHHADALRGPRMRAGSITRPATDIGGRQKKRRDDVCPADATLLPNVRPGCSIRLLGQSSSVPQRHLPHYLQGTTGLQMLTPSLPVLDHGPKEAASFPSIKVSHMPHSFALGYQARIIPSRKRKGRNRASPREHKALHRRASHTLHKAYHRT